MSAIVMITFLFRVPLFIMKNRAATIGLMACLLPALARPDVSSYPLTGYSDIFSAPFAFRPQWSPDGFWIVYDNHEQTSSYTTNSYKIYRMHPDGSGNQCLTCSRLEVPLNSGGAQMDITGQYVVFSAEQAQHAEIPANSTITDPGGGIYNDLALLDLSSQRITRMHIVGSGLGGQPVGGTLFPRFSHSGTRIAWGDYLNAGTQDSRFGAWQIAVADFVTYPTPHLENIQTYTPGPRPDVYEIQGWSSDDSALLLSTAPLPGQDDFALDIARFDLSTQQLSQLTFTAGVDGQPAEYEEHAEFTEQGDALAFMSSTGYGIDVNDSLLTWLKTELWIANPDGSQPQQITSFNVPGGQGYNGQRAIVSMLSWSPDASAIVANVFYYPESNSAASSYMRLFSFNTPPPSIGGVISASGFGGAHAAAPGSLVEVYGLRLSAYRDHWGAYFVDGKAPVTVDNVTATVGGVPAYVVYVSPTQVNLQIPSGVTPGAAVPIIVSKNGIPSTAITLAINALEPGLLAPPAFNLNGIQYVAAFHANGSLVGNGKLPGIVSTPAKPGETVVFYGIGFGPVNDLSGKPLPVAGQVVTESNVLVNPVQFFFGTAQRAGTNVYAGISPNYTGLYQFNVTVPADAPNGDLPLKVTLGGTSLPQTLYITVQD